MSKTIKKNFFAPLASGLGAMRRAAMMLLVMMLTTMTAWAQEQNKNPFDEYMQDECTGDLTISTPGRYTVDGPINGNLIIATEGDVILDVSYLGVRDILTDPINGKLTLNVNSGSSITAAGIQATTLNMDGGTINCDNITFKSGIVSGGTIDAASINAAGSITGGNLNAGYFSAGGSNDYINTFWYLTISGGSISATTFNIATETTINVTDPNFSIRADTYGNSGSTALTISGRSLIDEDGNVYAAGEVNLSAIAGKTLKPAYTVAFDENGGSDVTDLTVAGGSTISAPVTTRDGYSLEGWYNGTNAYDFSATVTDDLALTAHWKEKKQLSNSEITVSAIADQTYTGSAIEPAVTVKDGETDITDQCNITYSDNTDAGQATITITAKDGSDYAGSTTVHFLIYKTVNTYYVDADGNMAYCTDFTVLAGSNTTHVELGSNGKTTWYVVNSDVDYKQIKLVGDVNLILCDGKTMTADGGSASAIMGVYGYSNSLTIYGQTAGTGKLIAYCGEGNGIQSNAITINGGTINATGGGYFDISAGGNVTINGGNVSANGSSGGIKAGGNIILGWSSSTDRISASNFSADGTISIANGKAFTNGTNVYTSATSSATLAALTDVTLQPITGVTLTDDGSGLTASLDPSSEEEVNIPVPVEVDHVNVKRIYVKDKASTVYLPFSIAANKVSGGTFYSFTGVDETKTPWEVTYDQVTGTIEANTPYIFLPDGTNGGKIVVNNGSDKVSVSTANPQTMTKGQWEFIGTYKRIKWMSDPDATGYTAERAAEIGSVYGFAAKDKTVDGTDYYAGQFVKIGSGAFVNPLRAYLKRTSTSGARTRGAVELLPSTMKVILVNANGSTTEIGTFSLDAETGDWYSLDGRKLSAKPTKKGLYINNGKKVVIR